MPAPIIARAVTGRPDVREKDVPERKHELLHPREVVPLFIEEACALAEER